MAGPLEGIRVLDIATFVAAPFCGTIMAEFGAEVIKIEQPGEGDSLRRFGTMTDSGDTLVWLSEARNKKSVTLDLRTPEGAAMFRQLVAKADVVLENFRPGTMEKWGFRWHELKKSYLGLAPVMLYDRNTQLIDSYSRHIGETECELFCGYDETDRIHQVLESVR